MGGGDLFSAPSRFYFRCMSPWKIPLTCVQAWSCRVHYTVVAAPLLHPPNPILFFSFFLYFIDIQGTLFCILQISAESLALASGCLCVSISLGQVVASVLYVRVPGPEGSGSAERCSSSISCCFYLVLSMVFRTNRF